MYSDDDNIEFYVAKANYYRYFQTKSMTLGEDRRLREFLKQLALANMDWRKPRIALPEKQEIELDMDKDGDLQKKRIAYLVAHAPKQD
jgi:hypothetical protein